MKSHKSPKPKYQRPSPAQILRRYLMIAQVHESHKRILGLLRKEAQHDQNRYLPAIH